MTPQFIETLLPTELSGNCSIYDLESALADSLYSGYIEAQQATFDRLYHHDNLCVPKDFDFQAISGLSNEMVERLERGRPQTFGHARKIPGLTPAALSTLLVYLTLKQKAA